MVAIGALVVVPALIIAAVPDLRTRIVDAGADGGVIEGRLDEWRVGARALGASPVVGHGPEGYRAVFGAHVDEGYVVEWGRAVITDRAHNGLLDTGLAFGLPGLLLAAAVMAAVAVAAARVVRRGPPRTVGLAVGVLAYGAGQQFLFPLSELDPLFWLLAGVVTGAATADDAVAPALPGPVAAGWSIAAGLAAGLAVVAGLAGAADVAADRVVARAVDQGRSDGELDRARALRPDSIRYAFLSSRLASRDGRLVEAVVHVERGLDRSPPDPALRGERAALLLEVGRTAEPGPARDRALAAAVDALRDVVADDPLHPRLLQDLGVGLALTGRLAEAEEILVRAVELAPEDPDAAENLTVVRQLIAETEADDPNGS